MATYKEIEPRFTNLYIMGILCLIYAVGTVKVYSNFGLNTSFLPACASLAFALMFVVELVKIYVLNWADQPDEVVAPHVPKENITSLQEVVSVPDSKRLDDGTRLGPEFSKTC